MKVKVRTKPKTGKESGVWSWAQHHEMKVRFGTRVGMGEQCHVGDFSRNWNESEVWNLIAPSSGLANLTLKHKDFFVAGLPFLKSPNKSKLAPKCQS